MCGDPLQPCSVPPPPPLACPLRPSPPASRLRALATLRAATLRPAPARATTPLPRPPPSADDIANLAPEYITFAMGGFITSVCSVLVCPWQFVGSPEAMTLFVAVFGSVLGPMFGIMIADFYITKKQKVILEDLYTLDPKGSLYFSGGWNPKACWAMLIAGAVAVGLAIGGGFRGSYGIPEDFPDVKDWGWLIGSSLGALVYVVCMPSASGAPEKPPLV